VAEVTERERVIESNKAAMRKKRRKIKMKKRFIVFLFLFLCAGVILTVLKAPFFNISGIDCVGQERLSREQILEAAQIKVGSNIFSVNIEAIKRRVAAIPAVSESNVRRIFPNKVKIWVRESKEAAFLKMDGNIALIDKNGKIIRVIEEDEALMSSMAEIVGITAVTDKPGEIISDKDDVVANEAYKCISVLTELDMIGKVRLIDLTDMSDFKIKYDNRLEIYLGSYENMEYKIRFIGKVIKENISEHEKAKLDYRGDKLYVGALEEAPPPETEETEDVVTDGEKPEETPSETNETSDTSNEEKQTE